MSVNQPGASDVHVNRPLTHIAVAYMQNTSAFIAGDIFPSIGVGKQSDSFFFYPKGEFNRDDMQLRAPSTESAGGTYELGLNTYYALVRAYHRDIPDQIRNNTDTPISLDRDATEFVTRVGLIKREVTWVDKFFVPKDPGGIWTHVVQGVTSGSTAVADFSPIDKTKNSQLHWNDAASTPIEDIRKASRYILESTGFEPNTLTLGKAVYDTLLDHGDILGRIDRGQTSGAASVNLVTLADLFEVGKVLVMKAIKNTAAAGSTAAHSFIGGKHALLTYAPERAGLMIPSAGYTFNWTGHIKEAPDGMRIKRFYIDTIASMRVEIEMSYDQKLIGPDLGYFFGNIVA